MAYCPFCHGELDMSEGTPLKHECPEIKLPTLLKTSILLGFLWLLGEIIYKLFIGYSG